MQSEQCRLDKKGEKRAPARFFDAKCILGCKVAEKLRNVFRTTSRTCGVSIETNLVELPPENHQKQSQKGLFLAPFQHNPLISPHAH